MGKWGRRSIYGLGAILAVNLFVYVQFLESKKNPYRTIISSLENGGAEGCEFSSPGIGVSFRFEMTEQECRWVHYNGGEVLTFAAHYPDMHVVSEGWEGSRLPVFFYLEYVSMDSFNANASIAGQQPLSVIDGIETYQRGEFPKRKFTGKDGVSVYVTEGLNTREARRFYTHGLWVTYQYPKALTDLRAMDEFAMSFLDKVLVK